MTSGQLIVLILLVISLIAGIVSGTQIYYRLSYLWGLLLLSSWIWAFIALRGIKFNRKARALRAQVGQIFEERFELDNPGRLPRLWLAVQDESTLPGNQGSRVFSVVEGRRGRTYVARTRLVQRGVFQLGPTEIESGDPFGLFPVRKSFSTENSLLVYPMMVNIRQFPSPPGIMPGGDALRRRTQQITPNAAGVREYAPGDPLSRIHWVSTARRGRLISKEFELDPQAEVWLFLDASKDSQYTIPYELETTEVDAVLQRTKTFVLPPSTEEYGVSIAASLGRYYLGQGRAVGFVCAAQAFTILPPERGGRQLGKLLESLALLKSKGNLPLQALVEIQAQGLLRGSTVVLITASVDPGVTLAADFLLRRGLRPVVVLIDASSFNGPSGTDKLEQTLKFFQIPVRRVKQGANLERSLSTRI